MSRYNAAGTYARTSLALRGAGDADCALLIALDHGLTDVKHIGTLVARLRELTAYPDEAARFEDTYLLWVAAGAQAMLRLIQEHPRTRRALRRQKPKPKRDNARASRAS